jgi:hypothetical protein
MDQKPSFFEKVIKGFLKNYWLFSEVFFWQLLFGIVGFIPNNSQLAFNIGVIFGIRLLTAILFILPKFLIWLLKLLSVGEKPEEPVTQPAQP